jgi:thiol-disulfide isomerase/thioredoxin
MKRIILISAILLFTNLTFAQIVNIRLTDDSVVKDTSGKVLTLEERNAIMARGRYALRAEDPKSPTSAIVIRELSEYEIRKRAEIGMPKPPVSGFFVTGRKPYSFNAKDLEGNKYKLKDLEGKVVVLNFWFVNCGPCRVEIPELNKIVEEYKDSSNVVFLAVALDDEHEVRKLTERIPFNYRLIPGGRYITQGYGITTYPTHAVLDKEGKVLFHTSGYGPPTITWLKKTIGEAIR